MRICLYQPDIPQNTGTILRTAACLQMAVDIIEPCGFVLSDRRMRRAGMDYLDFVSYARHRSWQAYQDSPQWRAGRPVLLTTKGATSLQDFAFTADDILILGRESAGVPDDVHAMCPHRVFIPVDPRTRSLNVAIAGAMVAAEALRQCDLFPSAAPAP
jgi:tRNA (cytidine/uridine-2'-O-)-methyltransferase